MSTKAEKAETDNKTITVKNTAKAFAEKVLILSILFQVIMLYGV